MANVVFVAPFFLETTLRFVAATASLPGVRVGLVSQDPESKLPPALRSNVAAHYRVGDALDADQIADATARIGAHLGSVDRIMAALEELQVPLAQVRQRLGIEGMDPETARNFRDKAQMKTVLRDSGLPCARHRLVSEEGSVWEFVDEVGFPIVIKPPAGAGARNTFRVDSPDQLADALRAQPPSDALPALLEEFITGQEHSFDSVCIDGELVWYSISRYLPAPLEVLRNPWIQWAVLLPRELDAAEFDDITVAATHALKVLGLRNGLTHMEWFRRADGTVAISEVAARPPGAQITSLLSYAHDTDIYRAWAHLMVHDEFDPPQRLYSAGAAYLRGQGTGRVTGIHGVKKIAEELGALVVEAKLPDEGQPQSSSYEGEGYVIVRHPETEVVRKSLERIVESVKVELGG